MTGKKQKFDTQFREGNVRIVTESGTSITQIAKDLVVRRGSDIGSPRTSRFDQRRHGRTQPRVRVRPEATS